MITATPTPIQTSPPAMTKTRSIIAALNTPPLPSSPIIDSPQNLPLTSAPKNQIPL